MSIFSIDFEYRSCLLRGATRRSRRHSAECAKDDGYHAHLPLGGGLAAAGVKKTRVPQWAPHLNSFTQ